MTPESKPAETSRFLTRAQVQVLRKSVERFTDEADWRPQMEARAALSKEFRQAIERTGILAGKALRSDDLAGLVAIVWKIQNLNAMVLPQLLGTYTYYRHFKAFDGDSEAFAAHMASKRPDWEPGSLGHLGAPPAEVGEDLAAMLQAPEEELGPAIVRFQRHPGIARAFSTGLLILWNPSRYGMVNNGSITPFRQKGGPLYLAPDTRKRLREAGRLHYGLVKQPGVSDGYVLGWLRLLAEIREVCELRDYFEVDWLLWRSTTTSKGEKQVRGPTRAGVSVAREQGPGYASRIEDWVTQALEELPPERLAAREQAIAEARELIQHKLGDLDEDDLRKMLSLFNVDHYRGRPYRNRFAPAFTGQLANDIAAHPDVSNRWIETLWRASSDEEVERALDACWSAGDLPGAGHSFPTMILHARDPDRFAPLMGGLAKGYREMVGERVRGRTGAEYLAYARGVAQLRDLHDIPAHGIDVALWQPFRRDTTTTTSPARELDAGRAFKGFRGEAFAFLADLTENNDDQWFKQNRWRFKEFLREPMRELVSDLGALFIEPHAPHLEHRPNFPETLANIRKNAYASGANTYWTHYWAAFHRRELKKTEDFQLYVTLRAKDLHWGMYCGVASQADRIRFANRLRELPELAAKAFETAKAAGVIVGRVAEDDRAPEAISVTSVGELPELVTSESLVFFRSLDSDSVIGEAAGLAETVAETFRCLYPLFALATHADPGSELADFWRTDELEESTDEDDTYDLEQLLEETRLSPALVEEIEALLSDKPQLVLYGPPGTGKTWLAERLGKYLMRTGGAMQVVQFHPSYGYEDFIEGIRPHADPDSGTVTYRVEPGIFRRFCDKARRHPKQTFVLVIDEINRGNLPRIFGELLYLLERRGKTHAVELPISRESFSIPTNLYLIGTMNTADQSIALIDVALRRRFHFVQLTPDVDLLRDWLSEKAPGMSAVAEVLDALNRELQREGLDINLAIGHSHFMIEGLDDSSLHRAWNYSVLPTIEDYFYGKPETIARFRYETFVEKRLGVVADDADEVLEQDDAEDDDGGD
jgi:MoxR-like ATPase/uncharacterized protein (DUF2461 family)